MTPSEISSRTMMDGEVYSKVIDAGIWGNARDVLAAPDEDQHAYGILRKCCRRRWRRCCMRPPVAVRSSPSLTCGSQNRMLETWQQRLPGSRWTGFPSPRRQPAPPFHLTPALRRYESHSNYQFTSSSSSICRYLATNRLC